MKLNIIPKVERLMKMFNEFKSFIAQGNVVDLAVGVVIGAAFGKIIAALVDGIVMPIISLITGGVDVSQWKKVLTPAVLDSGKVVTAEVAINYGVFIQSLIDFLIIAFVIFLVIKAYNRIHTAPAADAAPAEDVLLLREIRDSLKK